MHKIPNDTMAQFDAVLMKKVSPVYVTLITGNGSDTILISEANIRFLIPNRNMCVCL